MNQKSCHNCYCQNSISDECEAFNCYLCGYANIIDFDLLYAFCDYDVVVARFAREDLFEDGQADG